MKREKSRKREEKREERQQIEEQRLNLSRSWHKGHSHAYNTVLIIKSYTKDLSFPIFELVFQRQDGRPFPGRPELLQCYDLGRPRESAYSYS